MLAVVLVHLVRLVFRADVGIPGHGDHRPAPDGEGREHPVRIGQQHILRQDIAQAPLPQNEVGRQALGHGDQAQGLLPVRLQPEHHVQGLIGQMGKGMAGIHHLRGEDRLHLIPKPVLHLLALLGVHLLHRQPADVAGPQPAFQLLHHLVPLLVQVACRLKDGLKLLLRRLPGAAVNMGLLHQGHVIERAHPDHEKLVQIAGEDGGELQPFHQWDVLVSGLLQNPLVKTEPGQLPVLGIVCVYHLWHTLPCFLLDMFTLEVLWFSIT